MQRAVSRKLIPRDILISILFVSMGIFCSIDKAKGDIADLTLVLTIVEAPTCTFDEGNTITVSFGDVHERWIDGVSHKRIPINYNLVCRGLSSEYMTMTTSWKGLYFDGLSVIETSRNNLGLALYHDSTRLSNGDSINFAYNGTHPSLSVVPIKPSGATLLDGGDFSASMTIALTYQ